MKNLLTLSAILMAVISLSANATSSYQAVVRSETYQLVSKKLKQFEKSDSEGLDELIRLIGGSDTLRLFALHRLVALRCNRYLPKSESEACGETVLKMLRLLDFDIRFLDSGAKNIPAFVFVAFETTLIQQLNQESTGQYLEMLASKFEAQTYNPIRLFNLWDETLSFYENDELKAITTLAVLFQDTSEAQIHLEYLARRRVEGSRFFNPNVSRLARVIELMARLKEERPDMYNDLAYPAGVGAKLNSTIYHYYVPWFLAAKLKSMGTTPRMAALAPMMLSATYEFITSGQDYSYVLFDPKTVSQVGTVRDIYAGHSGAYRGSKSTQPAASLERTVQLFQQNTKSAMTELLKAF